MILLLQSKLHSQLIDQERFIMNMKILSLRPLLILWLLTGGVASAVATEIVGTVVAIEAEQYRLQLEVADLPEELQVSGGWFGASAGNLAIAEVGAEVRGHLGGSIRNPRLEHVWRVNQVADARAAAFAKRLRRDTLEKGFKAYCAVGDRIPNFALYNQEGDVVEATDLRGQYLVFNFVFTRCGMPEMCPASTQRMVELQEALTADGIDADVTLVTLSFDPLYDTPGILHDYARARGIDPADHIFLTGTPQVIEDLLIHFGILTEGDGPMMNHTMATLMVDPEGVIAYRKEGSNWKVSDFQKRLNRALTPQAEAVGS